MKNINEVREILSNSIDDLRSKTLTPVEANALSNLTGKYLSSINLEIQYNKLIGRKPEIKELSVSTAMPELAAAAKPAPELVESAKTAGFKLVPIL